MAENNITIEEVRNSIGESNAIITGKLDILNAISSIVSSIDSAIVNLINKIDMSITDISLLQSNIDSINIKIFDIGNKQSDILNAINNLADKKTEIDISPIKESISALSDNISNKITEISNKEIKIDTSTIVDNINNNLVSIKDIIIEKINNIPVVDIKVLEQNGIDIKNSIADINTKVSSAGEVKISDSNIKSIGDSVVEIIRENNKSLADNFSDIKTGISDIKNSLENNTGTEVEEYNL